MILADKIIQLRKENGWSQEDLAERLGVSRQAVSKWEGAQATPDLSKLLALSQLFGVTTDYLLKDGMETHEYAQEDPGPTLRKVTLKEAGDFLIWREKASLLIAGGVLLCIVGVVSLLLCNAYSLEGLGVVALLVFIAGAVGLFIYCGHQSAPYEFLEEEDFDTEYGVEGLAEKYIRDHQKQHALLLCLGVGLCILSPIPLLWAAFLNFGDTPTALFLCLTILLAGIGAALCVASGIRRVSTDQLLQKGDYSPQGKRRSRVLGPISAIYWLLVTAAYLAWSLLGKSWDASWIIWPIAGVLFAAIAVLCSALADRKGA